MTSPALVSVIDDDAQARIATSRLIRVFGYEVESFASADEFLASLAASRCACVVTDLRMPGMHGTELLQRLSACAAPPPVIFVTGHPRDAERSSIARGGPVCVLSKPFDAGALEACLLQALRRPE